MKRFLAVAALLVIASVAAAQGVALEYQVKAAYLFNFTKFVEWPGGAAEDGRGFTICVAETNPFGNVLSATIAGETISGRGLIWRIAHTDTAGACRVLFIPRNVPAAPYLAALQNASVLTVGEADDFIAQGGMIAFVVDAGKVRFDINDMAATRAQLMISSRLLRLARHVGTSGAAL